MTTIVEHLENLVNNPVNWVLAFVFLFMLVQYWKGPDHYQPPVPMKHPGACLRVACSLIWNKT